jgi:hypothetical protein
VLIEQAVHELEALFQTFSLPDRLGRAFGPGSFSASASSGWRTSISCAGGGFTLSVKQKQSDGPGSDEGTL